MTALTVVLFCGLGLLGGWLALLSALAVFSGLEMRNQSREPQPLYRYMPLAVLVPAHDEEKLIVGTVASILGGDYPRDLLEVLVVADNCQDETAARAREAGARCIIRDDPGQVGKGYALAHGLEDLRRTSGCEAVVILDADSRPESNFLPRMAHWVAKGHQVIQGRYEVDNPDRTWFTRLTHLGFNLKNLWHYPGLCRLGLPVPLRGSGMCLSRGIVESFGWPSLGLAEDVDFTLTLMGAGQAIHYDPLAISRQYMPPDPGTARIQRGRWSAGEVSATGNKLPGLLKAYLKSLNLLGALYCLYLASPPFSFNLLACLALACGGLGLLAYGGSAWPAMLSIALTVFYAGYICLGLYGTDNFRGYLRAIGLIPYYAVWRLWVHMTAILARRSMKWEKTKRV